MLNKNDIYDDTDNAYHPPTKEEYFILKCLQNTNLNNPIKLLDILRSLVDKRLIREFPSKTGIPALFSITTLGSFTLNSYEVNSISAKKAIQFEQDDLALKLKGIYPKGKKSSTNYYWAESVALIQKRLKIFYRKYPDDYTNEEILKATEMYVKSFNGDYRYMKLLKYFIFKEEIKDGMTESSSDLLTLIEKIRENETQEDISVNQDWTAELV